MEKKGLKTRVLIGSVALALPCLAPAGVPDGTLLGEIGAIGSYCTRLEPSHGSPEAFLRELTQQFGAQTTSSAEFRQAYDLMSGALARLGRPQGLALCGLDSSTASGGHGDERRGGR